MSVRLTSRVSSGSSRPLKEPQGTQQEAAVSLGVAGRHFCSGPDRVLLGDLEQSCPGSHGVTPDAYHPSLLTWVRERGPRNESDVEVSQCGGRGGGRR